MGLTNNWGDDIDEELHNKKKLTVGFMWNFISTNHMITRFDQEVAEVEGDYPKSEIMKMWFSTVIVMLVFGLLIHNALAIIGLPFFCLYGFLLIKLGKLLKRFKYPVGGYWAVTALAIVVIIAANVALWMFIA